MVTCNHNRRRHAVSGNGLWRVLNNIVKNTPVPIAPALTRSRDRLYVIIINGLVPETVIVIIFITVKNILCDSRNNKLLISGKPDEATTGTGRFAYHIPRTEWWSRYTCSDGGAPARDPTSPEL